MAIVVYPLNDIDFSAEDVGIYNATRSSGIYAGDDFAMSVTGSDTSISVSAGLAWMRLNKFFGVAVAMKDKTSVDMGLSDSVYPRIDALVLQFDVDKNGVDMIVKRGTASSNPKPPTVSRTEAVHELHLAHVRREAGASTITAASVTDLRLDSQYCGLMADAVTTVDTSGIAAQAAALIEALRAEIQTAKDGSSYLTKSGGTMTGSLDMAGNAIENLPDPKNDSDAANKGYARRSRACNWLKNSSFADPVNTKGAASYKGAVDCIDGWSISSVAWMVGIQDGYIKISDNPDSSSTATGMVRQTIPAHPSLRGKVVTFAAKTKGKDVRLNINNAATGYYSTEESAQDWVIRTITWTVPSNSVSFFVALQFRNATDVDCEWAALYEGEYTAETLPDYHPKGYMIEALDCGALTVHKTATLAASGWSGSAPYSQTVSVEGISTEDRPHVSPVYSDTLATALAQKEAWEMVSRAKSGANSITFYCFEEKPATNIPVQIEVNR